uniref:phenylalanine--tRNA ligase n=1 Tax=Syphacia muris TaxID=451379 RepID=A0A0N5AHE0_9BILA
MLFSYIQTEADFKLFKRFPKSFVVCENRFPHLSRWNVETMSPSTTSSDDLCELLLAELDKCDEIETLEFSSHYGFDHQKVIGAVKSLLSQDGMIKTEDRNTKKVELTEEGKEMSKNGSHEANVFLMIGDSGALQADVMKKPFGKVGVSKALAAGWISLDKSNVVQRDLKKILESGAGDIPVKTLQDLKKRKLISETLVNLKSYLVRKGPCFTTVLEKPEVDLNVEMISSGSWKTKKFKNYNFQALGVLPTGGHLHPLMKVRNEFRQIFLQMGFSEMPTNKYVESAFWNFDALFQPQQHPARDAHDTFFVLDPATTCNFPEDYLQRVKTIHSEGGYGSEGYNYNWKLSEAQKNVLRTHTTAVSARQLYELAQRGFKPSKMFSIDRVFRNETLDATHLAEFHQVEGVVAAKHLSLAHIMGLFTEFFRRCGITDLRYKPAYNPYTEPSMEIFAFHKGLKKWVEIGNSGMFRPEMLLPMGLPENVNVAGFGLSLERPTMIRYGLNNIRDLFGSKVDLNVIYKSPICRLEKE